jgi:hypothetical protein
MSELVVVGFKQDKYRASDVLDQLRCAAACCLSRGKSTSALFRATPAT